MADQFIAQIRAELDTQKLESQLNDIKPKAPIKIDIDKNYIKSQVESALRGIRFNPQVGTSTGSSRSGRTRNNSVNISNRITDRTYDARISSLDRQLSSSSQGTTGSNLAEQYNRTKEAIDRTRVAYQQLQTTTQAVNISNTPENINAQANAYDNLEHELRTASNEMRILMDSQKQLTSLERNISANKIATYYEKNTRAVKKYGDTLKDLEKRARNATSQADLKTVMKEFNQLQTQVSAQGLTGRGFFQQFEAGLKSISKYFGASAIIEKSIGTIQKMGTAVHKIDTAMTNLKMATDVSDTEAKKLMSTYSEMGKTLKATGVDVATSATEWMKQGESLQKSQQLAEDSIILSKIGGLSSEDSTKYLTSAIKGYKVDTDDALGIVDKLSAVDLASATSVSGLAEGMSEVAANANLAGISMDKLLGYLAVVGETTQESMSSVGTSFNAIFSRMGNIKLSRLKDYQNNGEDLSNVETVLRGEGIVLRDGSNDFRNFGEVLDETAGRWENFSEVSQRAIASAFAGTNHMNDFIILMENYNTAMDYSEISTKSSGEALEKFSDYQKSLSGKIEGFHNQFQDFSNASIDSGFLGGIVDVGTKALAIITSLIDAFGALTPLVGAVGIGLSIKGLDKQCRSFDVPLFKIV